MEPCTQEHIGVADFIGRGPVTSFHDWVTRVPPQTWRERAVKNANALLDATGSLLTPLASQKRAMGCASSKSEAAELQVAPADVPPSEVEVIYAQPYRINVGASESPAAASPKRQTTALLTAKALKSAAKSGQAAILKLVPTRVPSDIPAWAAGLGGDREVTGWLEALQAALDALWEPLVSRAEARLAAPGAVPAYDSLKPASLLMLMCDVAGLAEEEQWPAAAACGGLLRMGAALWERTQGPGRAPSAEAEARFVNASLCRLLALLSLALTRTVAVEDAASFGAKLQAWRALMSIFGLGRPHVCPMLDAASKGLLLYTDAAVRGDAQLRLTCARGTALSDALPQWEQSPCHRAAQEGRGGGEGGRGGEGGESGEGGEGGLVCAKLFPRFHNALLGGFE